jgi:glycosyltransferase involved in cell wall biosynthesis
MAQQQKATDGIKILSVVWYKVLPAKFGGQKGVALFNEYLGRLAMLTCLCSRNNEVLPVSYAIDASLPVGKAQFLNLLVWRKIYATAKGQKTTHLILEFPYHGIAGILCKTLLRVKLIVHEHNIESLRFKEQKNRWWRILFLVESWVLRKADAVFFKTEWERQEAIRLFQLDGEKTTVVPYGIVINQKPDHQEAKTIICQRHKIDPQTKLLLFAGTLDYAPNAKAITAMVKEVFPRLNRTGLNYRVLLCGRIEFESFAYLKEIKSDHLLYAGDVADIDTYFAAADVFVNPVMSGGGVQTKIVDALSFDLNVVCFEEMTEGISGAEAKLFTAPKGDWQAFTAAINEALKEKIPTPSRFFECHDWNKIAEKAYNVILTN